MKRFLFCLIFVLFLAFSGLVMVQAIKKPLDPNKKVSGELVLQTETDGNIVRSWYEDSLGNTTMASDKGYAMAVSEYNDEDMLIRESYYDADGSLVSQSAGFCSYTVEYDGLKRIYRYFDEAGSPIMRTDEYAVLVRTLVSAESQDRTDLYYDVDMNPVARKGGYYGITYCYENGKLSSYTYLDSDGNPKNLSSGCASISRTYYSDGRLKTETYFDRDGNPTMNSAGHYGFLVNEYNDSGKRISVTSIDSSGSPMINSEGYSIIEYKYRANGTLEKTLYFDINGNPCSDKNGAYGRYIDGERIYFLTRSGMKYMSVSNLLSNFPFMVIVAAFIVCILLIVLPDGWKRLLFVLYILFILSMTILNRESGEVRFRINPLESYKYFVSGMGSKLEILNNIWLFIPYGVGLKSLVRNKVLFGLLFALPIVIELTQLIFALGTFETADIINNCVGELIGIVIFLIVMKYKADKQTVL